MASLTSDCLKNKHAMNTPDQHFNRNFLNRNQGIGGTCGLKHVDQWLPCRAREQSSRAKPPPGLCLAANLDVGVARDGLLEGKVNGVAQKHARHVAEARGQGKGRIGA
jgi:hypothetical protein